MSKVQHTPGPWNITDGDATTKYIYDSLGEEGLMYPIATVEHGNMRHLEANARLIAAAPELLDALDLALQGLEVAATKELPEFIGFVFAADKARAAIAKTRGE